ncbi:unnamed protein product [Leptidea sinapis]|uniref:Uncharacterized protein n=1 Tax=Leptidea sinapis TaxID=189913 RepID=A0A5E4PN04_9NEOP|nr:unnamed protein product [Leptidea sinapis]
MFKLVALCALVAVAAASPDTIISSPLAYSYSAGVVPAVTYSSPLYRSATPLLYSSPAIYPGGIAHLIKKRSAPVITTYGAPWSYSASVPFGYASSYSAYSTPYATTYSTPLVHSSPLFTTAHLIKKRSVGLVVPSTYSYNTSPLTYSYGAPGGFISSPYYSAGPLTYAQWIKK